MSVAHIHVANWPLVKTVHHASFVTTTEAELFAIRCGINQALSLKNISRIVVITDSIHVANKIFDCGSHPYQIHAAAILSKLQSFFSSNESNNIKFWECPSKLRWKFHHDMDKDSKSFSVILSYPTKMLWDYCKKVDCNESAKLWKMTFQASDGKGKHFLDLLDDDSNNIEPSSAKGSPWLHVKIIDSGLHFIFSFHFYFYFLFHFRSIFLFLELGIGLSDKDHTVTW